MAIIGIILGLLAAFSSSLSYLCSRMFVGKYRNSSVILLALSHVIMGIFSLVLLPFVWDGSVVHISQYAVALVSCTFFYLAAQICLFIAFKNTDASRVAPLLGLKVFFVAIISLTFFDQTFIPLQWAAVALSVGATIALTQTGGKLSRICLTWILIACLGYGLSDLGINSLIDHFQAQNLSTTHSTVLSVCLCYLLAGLIGLGIMQILPPPTLAMWKHALPFSMVWYMAMFFLFGCFAHVGVVYGVILQSTRGVISIVMGYIIAKAGFVHLETKTSRMVLLRRILAAILMLGAIGLYYKGANP